jgi:uncharacterized protein (UPF0276 family)
MPRLYHEDQQDQFISQKWAFSCASAHVAQHKAEESPLLGVDTKHQPVKDGTNWEGLVYDVAISSYE